MTAAGGAGPRWGEVWNNRRLDPKRTTTLSQLMALDGLDTGFGTLGEEAWLDFVRGTSAQLGIEPGTSVFEVGCGAGAFLFDLHESGIATGGIDYSETLVGHARRALPMAQIEHGEASTIDESDRWDFVIAMGVFNYFPSLDHAAKVVRKMVKKARRAVAILDVSDAAKYDEALRLRKGVLGDAEYEERYRGLEHLYVAREWWPKVLGAAGCRDIEIRDQSIRGYANSSYRYNVTAKV